ncbi:HTH-type transcriptional regulator QacR [Actinomadura rubteroloni]|uniref:HTH-type transcriptional regulator QacR n=1 Tax=Actinomadura rubteroloni TaxID=1926885 RepID=A0A2P4UBQ9_9ACTN|nr:TetR/AcrR family transcriptional regulator [Actinomadura rubteroloni]POM22479.1 HTH-type transcriptional regulator QacR [Actinomadura rubteroloni]
MTQSTKNPATPKGEATRAFLLATAARVFAERGYTATTQNELIAASGLTKGAFYFYFPSKRELALAVLEDQQARWLEKVGGRVLAASGAPGRLRALVHAMLDLIRDDPGAWSVTRLTRELSDDPAAADQVRRPMRRWVDFVAGLIRDGQANGELRAGPDPEALAVVLVGAFDGLKSLTDVLDPGEQAGERFAERARVLLELTELALVRD